VTTVERYCRRITARVKLRAQPQAPRFDSYAMALQAAVDGVGVAICLRPYVENDLASGRLVAPFKLAVPKGRAWYLIIPPVSAGRCQALTAFRDWLMANVKRDPG
jgi:DNA-binding transcriptional LysR family regulator